MFIEGQLVLERLRASVAKPWVRYTMFTQKVYSLLLARVEMCGTLCAREVGGIEPGLHGGDFALVGREVGNM